ncbi:HTH domain-containing protein [Streptosporangium sp. LJ11]|uniref:HTH domain-containing protein n=1 Tax=Streptosporangium sp. LJ11 TaxID=3436927 RepID=UPI003F7AB43E
MANTGSRTLRLPSLLHTHRHWPGAESADRLEVSGRTLRRDVGRPRELGYPVSATRGTAGGRSVGHRRTTRPLSRFFALGQHF